MQYTLSAKSHTLCIWQPPSAALYYSTGPRLPIHLLHLPTVKCVDRAAAVRLHSVTPAMHVNLGAT